MRKTLLLALMAIISMPLWSQTYTVKGIVTDDLNDPLPGVAVAVKGTSNGTVSDMNGAYQLNNLKPEDIIVFSFMGMKGVEEKVGNRTVINVMLAQESVALDELVVVGYGAVKKSDLTGAVSVVKTDNTLEMPAVSIGEALQGKVSGVNIIQNTGEPGSGITFNIRGASSITGSNQPLYVIDGQPIESDFSSTGGSTSEWMTQKPATDPLANINPSDIESIQVLKDASSTAIFGSRGANGVVLIETKSGKEGKSIVKYSFRGDVRELPKKLKVASTAEYMDFMFEADSIQAQINGTAFDKTREDVAAEAALLPNTNWQDLTYDTSFSQEHQVSLSGGTKDNHYYFSGSFTDNNGIVKNSNFQRYGFRLNFDRKVTDRLSFSWRSTYNVSEKNQIPQANSQGNLSTSVVLSALAFRPLYAPFDESGELSDESSLNNNPVVLREQLFDKTKIKTTIMNISLKYNILPGLDFSVKGGINDVNTLRNQYWTRQTYQGQLNDGSATRADNQNFNYVMDYMLNFNKTFKQVHSVSAVGGYSWQEWNNEGTSQKSTGFLDDRLGYYAQGNANFPGKNNTFYKERALASYLGRVVYSYDGRYVLNLAARYDGSSRLAPGHKWTFFPSVGVAWNVHEEKFMASTQKVISALKLRASWGISGNDNVGIGASQAQLGTNDVVFNQNIYTKYVVNSFDKPTLTWEKTRQINIGFDLGLFRQKVELSAEYYQKNTTDLLLNKQLPGSASYTSYQTNDGEILNRGVDIDLKYRPINTRKMSLSFGANISFSHNKILSLGSTDVVYGGNFCNHGGFAFSQPLHMAKVGGVVGAFIGYKTNGIFQNQEQIDQYTYTDASGNTTKIQPNALPGDIIYIDSNNDGRISEEDITTIGNPYPDFTYGFNLNFRYRKLTVSANFVGSHGNELINFNMWPMGSMNAKTSTNIFKDAYDNRWCGEGTGNNVYPRPSNESTVMGKRFPDFMVEDASYFRMNTLTIGYDFKLPKSIPISSLRLFATGSNLFTITDYSGYDPAINAFGDKNMQPGVDFGTLPSPRMYSFGVEVTF
ncbi:TonB-dependent receptor [Bacteroides sp. 51]|uniref:SusC/RagA family TonB-linked outer membrane protein n=1 Tax=Bacteroides sp. 51 TaxID=2302938 RepID=UPI0013D55AC9|nr:TonB-dependent receptor [Bacteroides sp. 51]NDV81745.1 TonB-dependent receptor [Bacteroides sp. 51]